MSVSRVTIIAGGHSASRVNLKRVPGCVIAVNDAAIYAPRIDTIVSMDRLWAEGRFDVVARFGKPLWLRKKTLGNLQWRSFQNVVAFENDHTSTTMSDAEATLNGTNSGLCAINLAYILRPRELYLVGFDMRLGPRGERHWFPDYPWKNGGGSKEGKLQEWARQFRDVAIQLNRVGIRTVSVGTPLPPFPQITPSQLENIWRG